MRDSRLARLIKTFTFRLALVYVGLFSLSVILLFTFIYAFAQKYTEAQIDDAIKMQYSYLLSAYKLNGSAGVEDRIKQLIAEDDEGKEIYLVANKDYEKLSGNLDVWPVKATLLSPYEKEGTWISFRIESSKDVESGIAVKALTIPLSKWRYLLVGQTTKGYEKIEQVIVKTFWASLLVTFVMAFLGAVVMTRSVMTRINVINRSAHTIMHGNLSIRIPFTKGGDEFDDLSSNLNEMLDKIEILLQSISLFANNIAHDLRSPLNRIINRLDAGLRAIDTQNPARNLLEKNIHDMEGLVATFNSILKISELEAGSDWRDFAPIDMQLVIADLVEFYEPIASEKGLSLTHYLHEPLIIVGERNLLTQAFANLIDNAIKFTPSGGQIDVFAHREEEFTDIVVADNGAGIPEDFREKVFEKFFRLEESRNTKGNGLGLSLVSAIARIHNATILLEDNNPGLRVHFRSPTSSHN